MNSAQLRDRLQSLHAASYQWSLVCCRGNAHLAAEILQSTYVKVLEQQRSFRGDSSFRTWFFAVIRNTARETVRKESVRRAALQRWATQAADLPEDADAEPTLELHEEVQALRTEMTRLSRRQQQVLHLVFYETMTIQESANVLGITVGSARKHYERAKQRLREGLGKTPTC